MRDKKRNHSGDITELLQSIEEISQRKSVYGFEAFAVKEFAGSDTEHLSYQERKQIAWKHFSVLEKKAIKGKSGKCLEASAKTKRRWFGINGEALPKRFQIFQLAFELELSPEKTEAYLKEGLEQPGVQYNDYKEWLYLYGLQNKISYQRIQQMIYQFEAKMEAAQVFEQTTHTNWLKEQYMEINTLPPDEFFRWMCENVRFFKGYSKTALHYFEIYKNEVLKILRREEKKELQWMLQTTDYGEWKRAWQKSALSKHIDYCSMDEDQRELEMVRRYIKHASRRKDSLSPEFCRDILNTARLAYGHENTHYMLSSLYPVRKKKYRTVFSAVSFLSDKQVSELLHVASHKEAEMRISQEAATEEQPIGAAAIGKKKKEAARRVILLDRSHLLPLIHYVAQAKYSDKIKKEDRDYCQSDAITYFTDMANGVLLACGMEGISEEFILDCILLSCFQTEDMYQVADVMELIGQYMN